jgi:hypothetical protein
MQLEGSLNLERTRVQRWVPVVAIIVPVFLCMAVATWFIRSFIAPPVARISAPMLIAAAVPEPPTAPQSPQPPIEHESTAPSGEVTAFRESASPRMFTMFDSFALAPPRASLGSAPPDTFAPEPHTATPPLPADDAGPAATVTDSPPGPDAPLALHAPDEPAAARAALDQSEPLPSPIPLPPRRRLSALPASGPLPLPRVRPTAATETPSTDAEIERRIFSAHGPE